MPVQGKLAGSICGPFGCTVFHGKHDVIVIDLEEYREDTREKQKYIDDLVTYRNALEKELISLSKRLKCWEDDSEYIRVPKTPISGIDKGTVLSLTGVNFAGDVVVIDGAEFVRKDKS
jgi:hypothetical protein